MGRAMQFLAFDLQLVSSGVYFGAAGLLIFAAAVLAGRKSSPPAQAAMGGRDCRTRFGDSNAELAAARSLESQRSGTKNIAS